MSKNPGAKHDLAHANASQNLSTSASAATERVIDQNGQQISERREARVHIGPLPPPDALAQYEALSPGMTQWMRDRLDQEASHRRALENRACELDFMRQNHAFARSMAGLGAAFVVATSGLGLSYWLIANGFGVTAGAVIMAELVALTTAFIMGRRMPARGQDVPSHADGSVADQQEP